MVPEVLSIIILFMLLLRINSRTFGEMVWNSDRFNFFRVYLPGTNWSVTEFTQRKVLVLRLWILKGENRTFSDVILRVSGALLPPSGHMVQLWGTEDLKPPAASPEPLGGAEHWSTGDVVLETLMVLFKLFKGTVQPNLFSDDSWALIGTFIQRSKGSKTL